MLSRIRASREKSKRPSLDLLTLTARHAERIRRLWKLSRFLQGLRSHLDLELPKIVLLRGSLVKQVFLLECLTGVKIPPELDLEQKHPIEFRLINTVDNDRSCRIKIRREYKMQDSKGQPESIQETPFGEIVDDPGRVVGLLREAQSYLIAQQHSTPAQKLHQQPTESGEKMRQRNQPLSNNVICVEIRGESVVDMTLITFPSFTAIQSNRTLQEFTLNYLATNCWILLLTPGMDCLQVHPAFYFAQQVDPLGDRTLGLFGGSNMGDVVSLTSNISSRSVTIRSRLEALHTRSMNERASNPALRLTHSSLKWKGSRSGSSRPSRWRVGRLDGQFASETRFDLTFDDLELKLFLENISCELFEKSMPKTLELINQMYLVDKSISISKRTDEATFNDVFRYTLSACASEVKQLLTNTISGESYNSEIESIYKLLGRRAFAVLPLFIPLASQDEDIAAFRQITEFSDMNMYADAYRFKDFENTAIFSRRPRVYLKEVRYHLKRMSPEESEVTFCSGQKTPLMEMPIIKWKSYALDAMASVICLLEGAIEDIISRRCQETPSFQPHIVRIIFLQLNQIFDDAKESLSEELEFELVPYTEFFQHFSKIRDGLLGDYHLSCHLLHQTTENTRGVTKKLTKAKIDNWDVEIEACADAGAYLNLALANFLDKTSMIIEKELLEQIELSDFCRFPVTFPPSELRELQVSVSLVNEKLRANENSSSEDADRPLKVAEQLANMIESAMKDTAEELRTIDPFMKA